MTATSATLRGDQHPKQLAALFLLGAFLVGGTLGVAADRTIGGRAAPRAEAAQRAVAAPPTPEPTFIDEFTLEIGLTPEQRAAVDSIMDERHKIIDSIVRPVRPQITTARENARRQIRQLLTPEQERRFDRYLARTAESGRD